MDGYQLAECHTLYRQTIDRLDRFQLLVNEGKQVDEANDFARWVLIARIPAILSAYDNDGLCKVDSALLRWKTEELRRTCCDAFRLGKVVPSGQSTQLEGIRHALDLIAGQVNRIAVATVDRPATPLQVVEEVAS